MAVRRPNTGVPDRVGEVSLLPDGPASTPWASAVGEVVDRLETNVDAGLVADEVARRLDRDGHNELAEAPTPRLFERFVNQFRDPMVALLLGAIVVSALAWWTDGADGVPIESVVIAVIVLANAIIGVWQEGRAIDAVAALRRLAALRSTVVRSGRREVVAARDLVVGDIVELAEGDAVAADARIVVCRGLEVSEAALTGESLPVAKLTEPIGAEVVVADRSNMVFGGTAVTKGTARCVVTATGPRSEMGRIAALLEHTETERTPLQRQIDQLSRRLGVLVLVLAAVVVGAIVITSDISSTSDVFDALLVAVSLAVAAVPEGLPAILTVVLSLGVQRMASHRAIVKRLLSVETLGSASVICTDKTGTLTRNEMTVVRVGVAAGEATLSGEGYLPDGEIEPLVDAPGAADADTIVRDVASLLVAGAAASDASIGTDPDGEPEIAGDPTEVALVVAAAKLPVDRVPAQVLDRVDQIPFDSDRKLMTTLHTSNSDGEYVQFTKGAPDVLLDRCIAELDRGKTVAMSPRRRARLLRVVDQFAREGLRTIAVARRCHRQRPQEFGEDVERELVLLGVAGIADPPKAEVIPVIAEARRAGVRTVMVTGDHPRTAQAIGRELGLDVSAEQVVTGEDLRADASDGADAVVFARVAPEDKLRIVERYQRSGAVVAMTGDGVNDAPALRRADIGVAMGRGGTEVAREAADMILADDNFSTIVRAMREGREIFADIRKFLRYLLASNCGEVLVMVAGVLAAAPLGLAAEADGIAVPLLATQILWINLLTDSALALALGVDPSVDDVMADPPRRLDEPIINRSMWVTIVLVGLTSAVAGLVALDLELAGGMLGGSGDLDTARTMLFTTVVLAQVFNAFNSRSDRVTAFSRPFENRLLWGAVALTVVAQVAVVHLPALNNAFSTTPLDLTGWAICWVLASSVLFVNEIRKAIARRHR